MRAQQIVHGVQDAVLPRFMPSTFSVFLMLNVVNGPTGGSVPAITALYGQKFLELPSLLGEKFHRFFPGKRIRGHDEPLRAQGGGGEA